MSALHVGQAVECQFEALIGGQDWFPGHIEANGSTPGTFNILFDDGDREANVMPRFIRPLVTNSGSDGPQLPPARLYEVGDAVLCQFEGALGGEDWYPGRIQGVNVDAGTFDVLFDDGDREDNVHPRYLRHAQQQQQQQQQQASSSPALAPNATVESAAVAAAEVAAKAASEAARAAAEAEAAAADAALAASATTQVAASFSSLFGVGTAVECQFEGALGGQEWYPGHVEAVDTVTGTYNILFEDGDREANVLPQFVRAAAASTTTTAAAAATTAAAAGVTSAGTGSAPRDPPLSSSSLSHDEFLVGDAVECQFEGALGGQDWYAGRIEAAGAVPGTFIVLYEDGDLELDVAPQFLRRPQGMQMTVQPPAAAVGDEVETKSEPVAEEEVAMQQEEEEEEEEEPAAESFYQVGDAIECQFEGALGGVDWYSGRIEAVHAATFDVLFDDGDREAGVAPEYIRLPTTHNAADTNANGTGASASTSTSTRPNAAPPLSAPYTVGAEVDCQFEGAVGGTEWFPGRIEAVNGGNVGVNAVSYDVLFDDGDREAGVAPIYLRPRTGAALAGIPIGATSTAPIPVPQPQPQPQQLLAVGTPVECQFEGALGGTDWYLGRVEGVNVAEGRYNILFDDGDREADVLPQFVRERQRLQVAAAAGPHMAPEFPLGAAIECQFEGALGGTDWYSGRVENVNALPSGSYSYDILFDDGDREAGVAPQFIRLAPRADRAGTSSTAPADAGEPAAPGAVPAEAAPPAFAEGHPVECQFEGALGGQDWYPGVIEAVHSDSNTCRYDVLFNDGDREAGVAPQFLRPLKHAAEPPATESAAGTPQQLQFAVGAMVDCQFEGALGGDEWFPGRVEAVDFGAGTYDILFDDGDREARVAPRFVRARSQSLPGNVPTTTMADADDAAAAPRGPAAFHVGQPIECQFEGALGGQDWYPGQVEAITGSNSAAGGVAYSILFDDGDREANVAPIYVRSRR